MWNLPIQSRLREVLFMFGLVAILCGLFLSFQGLLPFLDHKWWKVQQTWTRLILDEAPWGRHFQIWIGISIPLFSGFPTLLALVIAIFAWGPVKGTGAVILAQSVCSLLAMLISSLRPSLSQLHPQTRAYLTEHQITAGHLAFYPRLFLSLPCRTTDQMIAAIRSTGDSLGKLFLYSVMGLALRVTAQGIWVTALLNLLIDFNPLAELDTAILMGSSAGLIFLYLWPRIPEWLPQRHSLGEFFLDLTGERVLSSLPKPKRPPASVPSISR